ncbi:MAG: NTP transferase domain-containing protein [Spirochaetota bacterium]
MHRMNDVCAVVLAAGKGTRMKSEKPKVAVELLGKPLLHYVLDSIKQAGIDKIIIVVGYKKEKVISLCSSYEMIEFVEQKEQLGTGHALLTAETVLQSFQGQVLVACGDVPLIQPKTITALLTEAQGHEYPASVLSSEAIPPDGYGRIVRTSTNKIEKIVEHKDASPQERAITEINTGTYTFQSPAIFEKLHTIGNSNAQGEYYLPDIIHKYTSEGKTCGVMKLQNSWECSGVNSQQDLQKLAQYMEEGKHIA